jgi:hypothetical protein
VADKEFLDYHNKDPETYILTIMNMVADLFHDESVGNLLDIVVMRIIYLQKQEEELDLNINQDAYASLDSFCKWQMTVKPPDEAQPIRHGIAVLLTRVNICGKKKSGCSLLGLAYQARACKADRSCASCEDTGLGLSITVAHEIGHLMGCKHDDGTDTRCKPMDDDGNFYVMSPTLKTGI